jgi:hypothetical protein
MPNYNDWVALLYLVWHQPHQINVAYRAFKALRATRSHLAPIVDAIHWFDVGSGAYAAQLGLALHAADRLLNLNPVPKQPLPRIRIYTIDDSSPMLELGQRLWSELRSVLAKFPRSNLSALQRSVEALEFQPLLMETDGGLHTFDLDRTEGCAKVWVSGFHVVYKDNIPPIQRLFGTLVRHYNPHIVVLSYHDDPSSLSRTREAFIRGAASASFAASEMAALPPRLAGALTRVSEFRRSMYIEHVVPCLSDFDEGQAKYLKTMLTSKDTSWLSNDANWLGYERT